MSEASKSGSKPQKKERIVMIIELHISAGPITKPEAIDPEATNPAAIDPAATNPVSDSVSTRLCDAEQAQYFADCFEGIRDEMRKSENPDAYAHCRGRLDGAIADALGTETLSALTSDFKEIQSLNELAGNGDATRAQIVEALDNLCSNIAEIVLNLQKEQKISDAIYKVDSSIPEGVKSWLIPIIRDVLAELDKDK